MRIKEALDYGTNLLEKHKITQTPLLDASLLLISVTGLNRSQLYTKEDVSLTQSEYENYTNLLHERLKHTPIAYLTQNREFFNHQFRVTNAVLIPRPDTETLVEVALKLIAPESKDTLLDLCCGSGCVGISVAFEKPNLHVTLSDISKEALSVAKENSHSILQREVELIESDLFTALHNRRFHTIISNPPYLTQQWIEESEEQVKKEPRLALDGGGTWGLELIEAIIEQAPTYLEVGGVLALECDWRQSSRVKELLVKRGFSSVTAEKDLTERERVIWGRWYDV